MTLVARVGSEPLSRAVVLTEVGNYLQVPVLDHVDFRSVAVPILNGTTMNQEADALDSASGAGWIAVAKARKGRLGAADQATVNVRIVIGKCISVY